jgi:hypothetical protein
MPIIYRSTDPNAPSLTGEVGSLITVLDACLVSGYGTKAAAGWTKAFSSTNQAAYRQGVQGNAPRNYFSFNDNAAFAGGAMEASFRAYEDMSAINTGTNAFPTLVQLPSGLVLRKSAAASSVTREWTVVADHRTAYIITRAGDANNPHYVCQIGDIFSFVAGDSYKQLAIGRVVHNSSVTTNCTWGGATTMINTLQTARTGHYIARNFAGANASLQVARHGDYTKGGSLEWDGDIIFPNPADGAIYLSPIFIQEPASPATLRGRLRGVYQFLHRGTSVASGDTFNGTGSLANKTFLLFKGLASNTAYTFVIETSDWEHSV